MILNKLRRAREAGDGGFTLMEVVVSILLITMVMTGVLSFFIRGVRSASDRERRADAVQVATQQMELVRSVAVGAQPSTASTNLGEVTSVGAGLVAGRSKAAVATQWAATATTTLPAPPAELATMNQAYQAATVSPTAPLPISAPQVQVGNQKYDVRTYIGFCYVSATGCAKTTVVGSTDEPMYKVVVQVSWNQGQGQVKQYVTSTLINASIDQVYKGT